MPKPRDDDWVKSLRKLPTVDFSSIYEHFMERAFTLEGSAKSGEDQGSASFRGIDKGYRFFKDGHVQSIELNDLQGHPNFCYV